MGDNIIIGLLKCFHAIGKYKCKNELILILWMYGVTSQDRIIHKYKMGGVEIVSIVVKIKNNKLGWFGNIMRRDNSEAVRALM